MIHYPSIQTNTGDLPYPSKNDISIFVGGTGTGGSNDNWKIWNKPRDSTMVYIVAIGGGGGGGGGFTEVGNNDKGGGAGGGSGGISRMIIPSFFLPDILYVLAGDGGQGGAGSTAGTAGGISYVSFSPSTTAPNFLIRSNSTAAGGGGAGTSTTATGGSGGGSATATLCSAIGLDFDGTAGQAGANAPSGAGNNAGNGITAWASIPLSAGASGGSTTGNDQPGGAITANAAVNFTFINWPVTTGAVASAGAANGGHGGSGINIWAPFLTSGGAGGGTSQDATGGSGGNGGIGSGGGGGGPASPAGRGGNGGPGMVIIYSW